MKNQFWIVLLLVLALAGSGCANKSLAAAPGEVTESAPTEDKATLIAALQASDATVETGESVSQAFFSPEGNIIKVMRRTVPEQPG